VRSWLGARFVLLLCFDVMFCIRFALENNRYRTCVCGLCFLLSYRKKLLVNTVAGHWPRPLPSAHETPQRPGPICERPPVKCGSADADVERGIKCGEICGYYLRMLWVGLELESVTVRLRVRVRVRVSVKVRISVRIRINIRILHV